MAYGESNEKKKDSNSREITVMVSPVPDVPKPAGGRRTSKKLALKIELHADSLKPLPATD